MTPPRLFFRNDALRVNYSKIDDRRLGKDADASIKDATRLKQAKTIPFLDHRVSNLTHASSFRRGGWSGHDPVSGSRFGSDVSWKPGVELALNQESSPDLES